MCYFLQPGNFLLKGLEDMILEHKVKTVKMPVFVTLQEGLRLTLVSNYMQILKLALVINM